MGNSSRALIWMLLFHIMVPFNYREWNFKIYCIVMKIVNADPTFLVSGFLVLLMSRLQNGENDTGS